jgi:hypothetical protein
MTDGRGGLVANTIIAGVNKAGTTSLFVSLSGHDQVAPASVKETRYFLPARWGRPMAPRTEYEQYFASSGDQPIRLEATPSYFYGTDAVIAAMRDVCGPDLRVIVVLREPVARLASFFEFQKARLRLPETMTLDEYVKEAEQRSDEDFRDPENEKWFGVRGGNYADFLAPWHGAFGDRLKVLFFEQLLARPTDVLGEVARFLEIAPGGFSSADLSSENRTTGFKFRRLQRFALAVNSRFERFLRRHYRLKDRIRGAYYRLNGRKSSEFVPESLRRALMERYEEPNARLATQLESMGVPLPAWLTRERVAQ